MLNVWSGQGRLVQDIELKYTPGRVPVASFTIACDRDYKPRDGDRECDFIDIVAWRNSAEFVSKYFHKGDMIAISGRIQTRIYEDRNGSKRKATEIVGQSFNFCGSKRSDGSENYVTQGPHEDESYHNEDDFTHIPDSLNDEDLPFA